MTMINHYSTAEVAKMLGVSPRTVRRHLQSMGVQRIGRDYLVDRETIERLRERVRSAPGNPQFGTPEMARKGVDARGIMRPDAISRKKEKK